jgi:hypothetical protein
MNDLNIFNLNLESRKKITNFIMTYTEKQLNKITNNNKYWNGAIVFSIHAFLFICTLIIFFSKNIIFFNIAVGLCLLVVLGHFYFGGCIFIRLERHFFNTKNWWGPWMLGFIPLQCIGIEITSKLANQTFIAWGFLSMIYIFLRYSYF